MQLKRCKEEGGVIVCVPEHRLSLLLRWKTCEMDGIKTPSEKAIARKLREILNWWDDNVMEILGITVILWFDLLILCTDESDEQLRHKYQLLYPIGAKQTIDGGERRWRIVQESLFILKDFLFGSICFCYLLLINLMYAR